MFNAVYFIVHAAPNGAPMNFIGVADGLGITFTWNAPPGGLLIDSYTLNCTYGDGSTPTQVQLNPVLQFTLAELDPSTVYTCTISASTTGGTGPESLPIQITTAGIHTARPLLFVVQHTDVTITDHLYLTNFLWFYTHRFHNYRRHLLSVH